MICQEINLECNNQRFVLRVNQTETTTLECIIEAITGDMAQNTPNANMADRSVGTQYESHASEASQALMFCFDNASPEKSCLDFVVEIRA